MIIKDLVRSVPGVRRLSLLCQWLRFTDSASYWETNYNRGGTSGEGSNGSLAAAKAEFLNAFVREKGLQSVIELGCGDGNQLSLAEHPCYVGLDVSAAAIGMCKRRFADDPTTSFYLYDSVSFVGRANLFAADLAISLEVIYHLVGDPVYHAYMHHLFAAGQRYVVVYSTNMEMRRTASHVRLRRFTPWVEENCQQWRLVQVTLGPNKEPGRADFFLYEHLVHAAQ